MISTPPACPFAGVLLALREDLLARDFTILRTSQQPLAVLVIQNRILLVLDLYSLYSPTNSCGAMTAESSEGDACRWMMLEVGSALLQRMKKTTFVLFVGVLRTDAGCRLPPEHARLP